MGIIPDLMVRNNDVKAWWETERHGAVQMQSEEGLDEWSKAAGLNFAVLPMESGFFNPESQTWHKAPGRKTIVRTDNNVSLGWFTDSYVPHQPAEILDFFRNFLLVDSRFKLATMGSMKGGALIWALAEFESRNIAGDDHKLYALLGTSYNGMWSTFASATAIRAVCQNTVEASIYGKFKSKDGKPKDRAFRLPHRVAFDAVRQETAMQALADIASEFDTYEEFATRLRNIKLTRDQTLAMLNKLITGLDHAPTESDMFGVRADKATGRKGVKPVVSVRTRGAMADLVDSLSLTLGEAGNDGFNGWTAFNAVTRYVDHARGTRIDSTTGESTGQARLFSANFGSGKELKLQAVDLLNDISKGELLAA